MAEITKTDLNNLKKEILSQIKDMVEKEVKSQNKNIDNEKAMKEIAAKALVNFTKALYNKSSFWVNDVK
jgi:hypothetical protein